MLAGKEQSTFDAHKQEMLNLMNELNGRPVTLITTGAHQKLFYSKKQTRVK